MKSEKWVKDDHRKSRFSLIPPESIASLIDVLEIGAVKYSENNWMQCDDPMRYYDAAMRHLEAWRRGERIDDESGMRHLAHAFVNLMFIDYFDQNDQL